ncbi:type II toxin-antitoxin system RelE/ParE family toxin [Gloeobacter violaceus]|uniref:type II toxin-antitoxin system RelE/ParE family toxin n=1 Tax=Gloeobacter violaceus TaxID=33072 RepID=UPI0022B23315|nr:type II toxin-antitoxin system RelE/ParE family toxin [Gloeobacter violaceus]
MQFVRDLREHCRKIGQFPASYPQREKLGAGIRAMVHRRYLLFYREINAQVRIERIVHGARRLEDLGLL